VNRDELAFLNRQLASMLHDGIPLEGALRQLARTMRRGRLRSQIERLEAALAQGTPLDEALARSGLPPLYVRMVKVGVEGNNLPAVLTALADHYHRVAALATRLRGILFYPALVFLMALALSLFIAFGVSPGLIAMFEDMRMDADCVGLRYRVLGPPIVFGLLVWAAVVLVWMPRTREFLRWHVAPFKDACLAQLASSLALLLRGGCSLGEAVGLLRGLEGGRAGRELGVWEDRLGEGCTKLSELAAGSRLVPPLFVWLAENGGEDLASGFEHAARAYEDRAEHRTELLLHGALPVSVLLVAVVVAVQALFLTGFLVSLFNLLSAIGG